MVKVYLPKEKVLIGGSLNELASNLQLLGNVDKSSSSVYIIYSSGSQELFEMVLNQAAIELIVVEGGDIEGYLMKAEIPFQIDGVSIYEVEVPEGLQKRTMFATTGEEVIEVVKKLGQWVNADLQQEFSTPPTSIFVSTNPLGDWLKASEMILFINQLNAKLLTLTEFNNLI